MSSSSSSSSSFFSRFRTLVSGVPASSSPSITDSNSRQTRSASARNPPTFTFSHQQHSNVPGFSVPQPPPFSFIPGTFSQPQTQPATQPTDPSQYAPNPSAPASTDPPLHFPRPDGDSLTQLISMGFSYSSSRYALQHTNNHLENAVLLLISYDDKKDELHRLVSEHDFLLHEMKEIQEQKERQRMEERKHNQTIRDSDNNGNHGNSNGMQNRNGRNQNSRSRSSPFSPLGAGSNSSFFDAILNLLGGDDIGFVQPYPPPRKTGAAAQQHAGTKRPAPDSALPARSHQILVSRRTFQLPERPAFDNQPWTCQTCTADNPASTDSACFVCNSPRPASAAQLAFDDSVRECGICFDSFPAAFHHLSAECSHSFCLPCYHDYLNAKIADGEVLNLRCPAPDCDRHLSADEVESIVDQAMFEKYQRFKRNAELLADPMVRYCFNRNCQAILRASPDSPRLDCSSCGSSVCWHCNVKWHNQLTCQQFQQRELQRDVEEDRDVKQRTRDAEEKFQSFLRSNALTIRPCGHCRTPIQLTEGCYKMTCRCGYQMCFLCGSPGAMCNCTPPTHVFFPHSTVISNWHGSGPGGA